MNRITCNVHHSISDRVIKVLREAEPKSAFLESCRYVRQMQRKRALGLPGTRTQLDDAPGDRFYITDEPNIAAGIMDQLAKKAELDIPGHGSIMIQEVLVHDGRTEAPALPSSRDLSHITCILSSPGSGEHLAGIALDLGTGIPAVTLGIGTGLRDRLGLLRVTIPPEKELVHLIVPSHDTESIIQLLVEHGRLNRPGGGFVYQVPVSRALLDTRMRIGAQEHAASIEQIIAALDELRGSTSWRKRFVDPKPRNLRFMRKQREIISSCREGYAGELVAAAMRAGATGATISRVQNIGIASGEGQTAAWERVTCLVPSGISIHVAESMAAHSLRDSLNYGNIEIINAPLSYSYGS